MIELASKGLTIEEIAVFENVPRCALQLCFPAALKRRDMRVGAGRFGSRRRSCMSKTLGRPRKILDEEKIVQHPVE